MLDGDFSYGSLITHTLIFYGVKNHRCINFKGLVKKTIHLKITSSMLKKAIFLIINIYTMKIMKNDIHVVDELASKY